MRALIAMLVMLTTLLAALRPTLAAEIAPRTVRIAIANDADTLDPAELDAQDSISIAQQLWGTLYSISSDGKLEPYFAESYRMSEDGRAFTFKLRAGLKCEDGTPLTAKDAVFSFDHPADPAMKFTGHAAGFVLPALRYVGGHVDDELTFTLKIQTYNPIALGLIAGMYIFCRAPYEAMSREQAATHVSATGPYRLLEWQIGRAHV